MHNCVTVRAKDKPLAKPNYQFEKRQKELAKKKKKEEKLRVKSDRKAGIPENSEDGQNGPEGDAPPPVPGNS